MKAVAVVAIAILAGALHAYQILGPGYYLYNNVSVGGAGAIIAGVDTNSSIDLVVIPAPDFGSFAGGHNTADIYNATVGSGVYKIPAPSGRYTVIFESVRSTRLAVGAVPYSTAGARLVNLNGTYSYSFATSNYSYVNITVLSSADFRSHPLIVNVSGVSTYINSDAVVEYLNLTEGSGVHSIQLSSQYPEQVFALVSSSGAIVNPVELLGSNASYPVGVASYGVDNISGELIPYVVRTGEVVGVANISALNATSGNFSELNISRYGASLQLNLQLLTHSAGKMQVYWLQNVADFNTSARSMYFVDNIWNNTLPGANLSNATLLGRGNVTGCGICGQSFYAYVYPYYGMNYTLPLDLKLVVAQGQTANGTQVSFGYQLLGAGESGTKPLVYYDTVLIPGTYNSTIIVTPYMTTPSGKGKYGNNYYDAELVFAGQSNGADALFTELNASMWIYYLDNGALRPFTSAYTFGMNTQERATNVRVGPGVGGAVATPGPTNYSAQIIVSNALYAYAHYIANESQYTAPPTTISSAYQQGVRSAVSLSIAGIVPYLMLGSIVVAVLVFVRFTIRKLFG